MPRSAKDIQLIELKDTISKLNELILSQTGEYSGFRVPTVR